MTDEEVVKKIDGGEKLTEEEISSLIWDYEQVYEEEGNEHRWDREVLTVVKICNRYFAINWRRGLTEIQDNCYYEQPYEVACENITEVVTKQKWKPIAEVQAKEENEMIVVKQLPVIEQQLRQVSLEIDKKVNEAAALICTEENVKTIKDVRAALNKEAKEWEEKRKAVKAEVMKPYEEFEQIYKECIIDKYKSAELAMKTKVDSVESELKAKKQQEVKDYFDEYLQSKGIDFATFENANINVTLSASMKSLKEQAKSFIDKIADDLILIETQAHKAEILVEYKQSLNVSQAITNVNNRFKAVEEEKARIEREEQLRKEIVEAAYIPASEMPVDDKPLEQPVEISAEILTLKFTVRGTKAKLKELKEFLENGGFDYE